MLIRRDDMTSPSADADGRVGPANGTVALGIDLGLSGARAAVVDGSGRILGSGRQPCVHTTQNMGAVEHDPRAWIDETVAAGRAALAAAGRDRVDVIGVGGLGPAPVLLDAELKPVGPAPIFSLDSRADHYRAEVASAAGLREVGVDHVLPRLLWWAEEKPELMSGARWVVDAAGFIVTTFVGEPIIDRVTAADHMLEGVEAPVPTPPIRDPLDIAGGLTDAVAERIGLPSGTPVAVGTYDTFVDMWALGVSVPGDIGLLLGSTQALGQVRESDLAPAGLAAVPHIGEGWFVGGWTSAAGTILDWYVAMASAGDRASFLAGSANLLPGAGGLLALPHWGSERAPVWDVNARGALLGLTTSTSDLEIYRALIDSLALATRDLFNRLDVPPGRGEPLRVGGGGSRNPVWLSATADALGVPLAVADDLAAGIGPAFLGLAACGVDVPEPRFRAVVPDATRHESFTRLWEIYEGLYRDLVPRLHALGSISAAQATS